MLGTRNSTMAIKVVLFHNKSNDFIIVYTGILIIHK